MNLFNIMAIFPGIGELKKWDDSWTNTLKFWSTDGSKSNAVASTADQVIHFFINNQPYLQADSAILVMMTGFIQNGWYQCLYALAKISSLLITAALAPLYYLPKMLMNSNNPLHVLFYIAVGIGSALIILSILLSLPKYLAGNRDSHVGKSIVNGMFTIGMMFILPFIISSAGDFTQNTLKSTLKDPGGSSLAASPMVNNTVDVESWALTGFDKEPFSKNAPLYNELSKADNPIPDFTRTVTKDDISIMNDIATSKRDHSHGHNIKDVGDTFKYAPVLAPAPNREGKPQYSLEKLSLEKGITHMGDRQYKRFRVQNIAASGSFLVIIIVGVLFSIKIMRSTIGTFMNLISTVIAAGRDAAKGTESIKGPIMEALNSFMAIFIDVFMLFLYTDLSSTLPNQIASNYSGLLRGLVYLLVMGVLALCAFNGTSAMERQFGWTPGVRGQGSFLSAMTAPGAMLGSMLGGAMADKMRHQRMQRALKASEDQPEGKPANELGKFVNNGEKQAEELANTHNDMESKVSGNGQPGDRKETDQSENQLNQTNTDPTGSAEALMNNDEDSDTNGMDSNAAIEEGENEELGNLNGDADSSDEGIEGNSDYQELDNEAGESAARALTDLDDSDVNESGMPDSASGQDVEEGLSNSEPKNSEPENQGESAANRLVSPSNSEAPTGSDDAVPQNYGESGAANLVSLESEDGSNNEATYDNATDTSSDYSSQPVDYSAPNDLDMPQVNDDDGTSSGNAIDVGRRSSTPAFSNYVYADTPASRDVSHDTRSLDRPSNTSRQTPSGRFNQTRQSPTQMSRGNQSGSSRQVSDLERRLEAHNQLMAEQQRKARRRAKRRQRLDRTIRNFDQGFEDPTKPTRR